MDLIYGIKDKPKFGKVILFSATAENISSHKPIKNLKNKYNFKNLENILNEHFNYDNTNELQLLLKKDIKNQ